MFFTLVDRVQNVYFWAKWLRVDMKHVKIKDETQLATTAVAVVQL
jgi:hypothetical protein